MVTPIGDKKTPLTAESAEAAAPDEAACKRAACERTNGSTRGCRERSESDANAKVCVRRPRLQKGPSATLNTSRGVHLGISAHLEMGRRPMHVYTLTLKCTPRGHPKLSLGYFVTVCNRHSTLVHQGCFTFSDNDSITSPGSAIIYVSRRILSA